MMIIITICLLEFHSNLSPGVLEEAEFYNVVELIDLVKERIAERKNKQIQVSDLIWWSGMIWKPCAHGCFVLLLKVHSNYVNGIWINGDDDGISQWWLVA